MIHLYCRVSTDRQENGREAQEKRLREWVKDQPHLLWPDEDVSAFSTPLFARPEGKKMWDALVPGDTVVMTKIDRAFRSWADAADAYSKLRKLGVTLRFLDMDIDLSTPQGELFFSQMVAFAQFESRMHGQRKREVYAHKRKQGKPYNSLRPYGWARIKDKDGKLARYEPSASERALGKRVLDMRRSKMSWFAIASAVCNSGVRKSRGGYYHVADIQDLARAAAARYPIVPRAVWRYSDYEQRLLAMTENGFPIWPEGYDPSQNDPGPLPDLLPDRQSPSRASRGSPKQATGPQPLAG